MKKIFMTAFAVLGALNVNAQDIKFGAKAGLNLATISSEISQISVGGNQGSGETQKNTLKPGFHVGGFAEISLNDSFSLQPELHFSYQGSKFKSDDSQTQDYGFGIVTVTESNSKTDLTTMNINVPVLAKYNVGEKLFFVLGPQVSYLLSAKSKSEGSGTTKTYINGVLEDTSSTTIPNGTTDAKSALKSIDFGLAAGGGFNITENIFTEVRYVYGLSNFGKSQTVQTPLGAFGYTSVYKSRAIQLSFGYKF